MKKLSVFAVTSVILFLLSLNLAFAQFTSGGPQGGEVYKEYYINIAQGSGNWRVTDPNATNPGTPGNSPADFLPNPNVPFSIDDYTNVSRVEVILDVWGGHVGTTGKQIRFNGNNWITLPEIDNTPTDGQCYVQQLNYTIDVPVSDLTSGSNTIQGTAGSQTCHSFNWGQWGWYGAVVRVYYSTDKGQTTGQISNIITGDSFMENPNIRVAPNGPVSKIEVVGNYEYYDVDGDGYYKEWVGDYHRTSWADNIDLNNHIGTTTTSPYQVTWNTRWVPDQEVNSIKLQARIQSPSGYWYATDIVDNLTLFRNTYSVKMQKASNVPQDLWVRANETKTCRIIGPVAGADEKKFHIRTWNGMENTDSIYYTTIQGYEFPKYGRDHYYSYNVLDVPGAVSLPNSKLVTFHSQTLDHGIEVLWPGPALFLRFGAQPTTTPPSIVLQPIDQDVTLGASATLRVNAMGGNPITYQWRKNGVNIPGANLPQYITPELALADNGDVYTCYISNAYGNVTSNGAVTNVIGSGVKITNDTDEGIACYKIETNLATYYFDKAGGGFVSMIDIDGVDWISHNAAAEAAGVYRGFPNSGELHPGYTGGTSSTTNTLGVWQDSVVVQTARNGEQATFKFFPTYAKMTLNAIGGSDNAYWILFEGTPGGAVGSDDMVYLSNGISFDANQDHPFGSNDITNTSGSAVGSEWMYITDGTQNRSIFLALTDDNISDNYWQMQDNMTVFGSGRQQGSVTQFRTDVGAEMVIGFVESKAGAVVRNAINATWTGNIQATLPASPSGLGYSIISPNEVQLSWTDNSDNESNFVIERQTNGGGFSIVGTTGSNTTTYNDLTVTPGNTYFYRLSSSNSSGQSATTDNIVVNINAIATSPAIDFWYGNSQKFGHLGNPQNWINILGKVTDSNGTIASLNYRLNGGSSVPLSIGPNQRRLQNAGDFNIDIDRSTLNNGVNYVQVAATDNNANTSYKTVIVNYTAGNTWNTNYQFRWDTLTNVQNAVQIVDGKWAHTAAGIRTTETGYDRLVAIGDASWTNYEVTLPITINSIVPPITALGGDEYGVGLLMRWTGHTDSPVAGWQPKSGWIPNGEIGWFNWDEVGMANPRLSYLNASLVDPRSITLGVPYIFKFQVVTRNNGTHRYNLKVWLQSATEPTDWSLTFDSNSSNLANGSFMLIAHHIDATFGNISVTPLNLTLPSVPTNFLANQQSETVLNLSWTDASNNEENFLIQRRISGGTYADLAIVASGATGYSDATVVVGTTYDYRIRSQNAFGNSAWIGLSTFIKSLPIAPSGLGAIQVSNSEVSLTWTDNSNNEDNFILQRRLSGGTYADLDTMAQNIVAYSDLTIVAGNTYQYRVRAENNVGPSGYSNQVSLFVIPAPTAPSVLVATEITETEVSLTWNDNSNNEDNFVIQRKLSGGVYADLVTLGAGIETYSDGTVNPGSTYQYQIKAVNAFGESAYSNEANIYVEPAPVAPSGLSALEISETEVSLSWVDNSNNEVNFIIQRRFSGGTYADLVTLGAGIVSYSDGTVVPGSTYQYRVRSENNFGASSYSNQASIYVEPAPAAPTTLTAIELTETEVSLAWTDNSNNEVNFILQRRLSGGTYSNLVTLGPGTENYSDITVVSGSTYQYRVRAVNAYGTSNFSNQVTIYVEPSPVAPSSLTAIEITETEVSLTWVDNSNNENNFVIQRRLSGGTYADLATPGVNIESYSDITVVPGSTYQYRVRAINNYGVSSFSNQVTIYVEPSPVAPSGLSASEISETNVQLTWTDNSNNENNFIIQRRLSGGSYSNLVTLGPGIVSYSDLTVIPGSTYQYRVRATNAFGESNNSNQVTIYVEPAPSVPTGLAGTEISETEVSLTWTDNSNNEDNFIIQRRLSGGSYSDLVTLGPGIESYSDQTVNPGSTYQYRVRAVNAYGVSNNSNQVTVYVEPAPTAPGSLTATELGETEVLLEWDDNSNNENNFVLERRLSGGAFGELISLGPNVTSFNDLTVTPSSSYDYRIKAINSYGESSYSNTVNIFVLPAPISPDNLSALEISETEVLLEWNDNSNNEDNFVIDRREEGGTFSELVTVSSNVISYNDLTVVPTNTYYYRIRAINNFGESAYSAVVNIYVLPGPDEPDNLVSTEISETNVLLEWSDNSDNEESFVIERRISGETFSVIDEVAVNVSSYNDLTVDPSTFYDYRVKAVNQYGESGYTNIESIFILPAPVAPGNLVATEISETEVLLEWNDNSNNEDNFVVLRRIVGGTFAEIATLGAGVSSYSDISIVAGNSYEYIVLATNEYGDSPPSNQVNLYVEPAPNSPTALVAVQITDIEVQISWNDNSDNEDSFILERKLSGDIYQEIIVLSANTSNYSDISVIAGSTYFYRVRSENAFGLSVFSNESEIYVEPAPVSPSSLTAVQQSQTVILEWEDNSDNETQFILERKTGLGEFLQIGVINSNEESHIDSDIIPENTYEYRVKAINNFAESDYSNLTTISVIITGLEDLTSEYHVTVYPNPFSENSTSYLQFDKDFGGDLTYKVMDLSGHILIENEIRITDKTSLIELDISSFLNAHGVYFLMLKIDKDEVIIKKLIYR